MIGERAPQTDSISLRSWLTSLLYLLLVISLVECEFGFTQEPEQLTPLTTPLIPSEELSESGRREVLVYILLASIVISLITIILEGFDRLREYKRALRRRE